MDKHKGYTVSMHTEFTVQVIKRTFPDSRNFNRHAIQVAVKVSFCEEFGFVLSWLKR